MAMDRVTNNAGEEIDRLIQGFPATHAGASISPTAAATPPVEGVVRRVRDMLGQCHGYVGSLAKLRIACWGKK